MNVATFVDLGRQQSNCDCEIEKKNLARSNSEPFISEWNFLATKKQAN